MDGRIELRGVTFDRSSRSLLTPRDLSRFAGDSLFHRLARAVCEAGCLPRKELFESWEVAQRVSARFRGGQIFDLACGHGLLAHAMLLLNETGETGETSPRAFAVDARLPESAGRLSRALVIAFPVLANRIEFLEAPLSPRTSFHDRIGRKDLVVSAHACGALTDEVLAIAASAGARVAVLPCCHDGDTNDDAGLTGWLERGLAIDAVRAVELRNRGYQVHTESISAEVTAKNRLLLGQPLLELYELARYEAHLPSGKATLRHGELSPALDAMLSPNESSWALITAWNPGSRRFSRQENERRQRALTAELSGTHRLFPAAGLSDDHSWPTELSVLALGMSPERAVERGRAWGQVAVLIGHRGEPARVVLCKGY